MELSRTLIRGGFHEKSWFTDGQIIAVLKEAETGTPVPELRRAHGIDSTTFYKWRARFGGMYVL